MEIVRYVSEIDLKRFHKRGINLIELIDRSSEWKIEYAKTDVGANSLDIPIKIKIPDENKE